MYHYKKFPTTINVLSSLPWNLISVHTFDTFPFIWGFACFQNKYLRLKHTMYETSTPNIVLNGERLKTFPLKSGRRQGRALCITVQQRTETPNQRNYTKKRNQSFPKWKIRKLPSSLEDKVFCVYTVDSTQTQKTSCHIK